jgi:hypothetical protein
MSDEEKIDQLQSIENIINAKIDSKMKVIYWIIGGSMFAMLTIFVTIALPIQNNLIEAVKTLENKAFTKEVESVYLKKQDYYQIEEDEHRILKEVIKNPAQADYLIGVINDNIIEKLGFKWITRGGQK